MRLLPVGANHVGDSVACRKSPSIRRGHRFSDGRQPLAYGELVDAAAKLPIPGKVELKKPADFKLIGTPHRRLDTAGKVDGSAKYGIDTRRPGQVFAVVAISPTFGGRLRSVDEAKAKRVPGVRQIVRMEDAVAVVAKHTWAAKQGLAAANPQWDAGPNAQLSTADVVKQLAAATERSGAIARQDGNEKTALLSATKMIDAVYEQPFLAHTAMEPMNCTAAHEHKWQGVCAQGTTREREINLYNVFGEEMNALVACVGV